MRRAQMQCVVWVAMCVAWAGCADVVNDPDGPGGRGGTGGMSGTGGVAGMAGVAGMGGAAGMGGSGPVAGDPPVATIDAPATDSGPNDAEYAYDGRDDVKELWYTDVTLEGRGVDPEDGALTGDSLVWKTNQTVIQPEVLGTGESVTVRLYSDTCTGVQHVITLEATDSGGQTSASEPRSIVIWTLC